MTTAAIASGAPDALTTLITALMRQPVNARDLAPALVAQAAELGLEPKQGRYRWPETVQPIDAAVLQAAGPAQVLPAVDSTSRYLREWLEHEPAAWQLVTAECQTAGRGRQGRRWLSPLGTAMAVSLAVPLPLPPPRTGGFSLVTGLAVLDALDPDQRAGLGLKWPNDINAGLAKVGGILIEVLPGADIGTVLLVGIGLNYRDGLRLASRLDRSVSDLSGLGIHLDRTTLLLRMRDRLRAFTARFEEAGFEPFVDAFNAVHVCQGQRCTVHAGLASHDGTVVGVAQDGALLMEVAGKQQRFDGGEVSLRVNDGSTMR